MKYLLLALIIYGIYRFSTAPKIGAEPTDDGSFEDEEYTDYEEVE